MERFVDPMQKKARKPKIMEIFDVIAKYRLMAINVYSPIAWVAAIRYLRQEFERLGLADYIDWEDDEWEEDDEE
jgi:hypothetical protein